MDQESVKPVAHAVVDVPSRVFQEFVQALEAEGVSKDVVARLRQTLLVENSLSDKALREALFPETFDL
jgi:hypothetical protein